MSTGDKHQVTVFIALLRGGVNLGTACRLHPAQLPRAFLWLSLLPVGSGGLVAKSCCQAPLSMGFLRQEYWSRLPFPSPGDHPNPEIKPMAPAKSPAWKADFLLLSYLGSPYKQHSCCSCSVVVQQFFTPCIAAHQASLSFTISRSLL